jgi:hypothetical protein
MQIIGVANSNKRALQEICGPILGIYINRSQTHECGNWAEAGQFPEKENRNGFFVAVWYMVWLKCYLITRRGEGHIFLPTCHRGCK